MAVKLRLSRHGTTNAPFYWMVAADSRFARDGRYLEKLGFYNPVLAADNPDRLKLNKERIQYWLSVGAAPSDRILKLLRLIEVPGLDKFVGKSENKSTIGDPRTTKSPDKLRRNKKSEPEAVNASPASEVSEAIAEQPAVAEVQAEVVETASPVVSPEPAPEAVPAPSPAPEADVAPESDLKSE
jgi:small subunit ribosomal protein S16